MNFETSIATEDDAGISRRSSIIKPIRSNSKTVLSNHHTLGVKKATALNGVNHSSIALPKVTTKKKLMTISKDIHQSSGDILKSNDSIM